MIDDNYTNICSGDPLDDFVITVKTDNAGTSTSTQFELPTVDGGYFYDVDCDNDGTVDLVAQTGNATCNYGTAGTYTVRVRGDFPRIYFNGGGESNKILDIAQW